MTDHKVVTVRQKQYPFRASWACVCGHILKAPYMGRPLYKEFEAHAASRPPTTQS